MIEKARSGSRGRYLQDRFSLFLGQAGAASPRKRISSIARFKNRFTTSLDLQIIMSSVIPQWKYFFSPNEDSCRSAANHMNNLVMDKVKDSFPPDLSVEDCANELTKRTNLPILLVSNNRRLKVAFLHRRFAENDVDPNPALCTSYRLPTRITEPSQTRQRQMGR